MVYDIAIIGGGVLGTCISYWISSRYNARVCVIEKENEVAMHASGRNTGIIHSPFYLNPDTQARMAHSATHSHSLWKNLAERYNVPWHNTGLLELALDESQHHTLALYMDWGMRNGIPENGMSLLDARQVQTLEPNVRCHSAIHSTTEASTSFAGLTRAIKSESAKNGTKFLMQRHVNTIHNMADHTKLDTQDGTIRASYVINCAGGNSLGIAHAMGLGIRYSDLHFRGEYWLAGRHADLARSTIYTVPAFAKYPFLDPHWIKRPDGTTEVGPNAVPVPGPEQYSGHIPGARTGIAKLAQILAGGTKRLLLDPEFLAMLCREWHSSLSRTAMISRIQRFIPRAKPEFFTVRGTAGIRSPVITPDGRFLPDVLEMRNDRSFHIINYNSPGATGAPAYSAHIVQKLQDAGFLRRPKLQRDTVWDMDQALGQS